MLQDIDVIRNAKQVSAVLVCEQVVDFFEPRPSNATQAQATRLMCSEEDAVVPWIGPCFWVREVNCEELLDAVDLAME